MNQSCGMLIQSFEPVVEGLIRLEYNADGWELWIRHRHYGGLFADCQPAAYSRLTGAELADVLAVTVLEWGPVHFR